MRFHVHHHFFEEELLMANAALADQLSALVSVLSSKDETIASLSAAAGGDSTAISSAVSAAVDADETAIAESISSIISAG